MNADDHRTLDPVLPRNLKPRLFGRKLSCPRLCPLARRFFFFSYRTLKVRAGRVKDPCKALILAFGWASWEEPGFFGRALAEVRQPRWGCGECRRCRDRYHSRHN